MAFVYLPFKFKDKFYIYNDFYDVGGSFVSMLNLFHKYFGLVFTWVTFFIFFSGTLAYYREDITLFMQKEYYTLKYKNSNYIKLGIDYLNKIRPNADLWRINLPNSLTPYIAVSYKDDIDARQRRYDRKNIILNPQTGEQIKAKATYGGYFLGALHYNLWGIKPAISREIIAYITLAMLFILVTGVLIHKRIFKDFFALRRQILWHDTHMLMSIGGFVIFMVLTVSGLYLLERFILKDIHSEVAMSNKTSMRSSEGGDLNKIQNRANTINSQSKMIADGNISLAVSQIQNIININAKKREIESIYIIKNPESNASVQLNFASHNPFSKDGLSFEAVIFDMASGKQLDELTQRKLSNIELITAFMRIVHIGDFGGAWMKFIFFVFGCFGMLMCMSGAYIWEKKQHTNLAKQVVKFLNATIFIGLFAALGVYLLSNQLILSETVMIHHNLEVRLFFITLLVVFFVAIIFIKRYSYSVLSILNGAVFGIVFVLSLKNGAYENFEVFKISIFCLILSAFFGIFGIKFIKEQA